MYIFLFILWLYKMPNPENPTSDVWMPLHEYVAQQKQNRLINRFWQEASPVLGKSLHEQATAPKVMPTDIEKYFEAKNYTITPTTIREAMVLAWMDNRAVNGTLPDITQDNIANILSEFPTNFDSPVQLATTIWEYIKAHMDYDITLLMQQIDPVKSAWESLRFDDALKQTLLKNLRSMITFSGKQPQQLICQKKK